MMHAAKITGIVLVAWTGLGMILAPVVGRLLKRTAEHYPVVEDDKEVS